MAKKTRRGQKQCPKCNAWVKGTRAKTCSDCGHKFGTKPQQRIVATGRGNTETGKGRCHNDHRTRQGRGRDG